MGYKTITVQQASPNIGAEVGNIDLTNRCNLTCPICFANANATGRAYEPTKAQVIEMLRNTHAVHKVDRTVPCHRPFGVVVHQVGITYVDSLFRPPPQRTTEAAQAGHDLEAVIVNRRTPDGDARVDGCNIPGHRRSG